MHQTPEFDQYIFADYSGAKKERAQKKAIVLAISSGGVEVSLTHHTRDELFEVLKNLLHDAHQQGKRVIGGVDHSYSFPVGFYEIITAQPWSHWDQMLEMFENEQGDMREWASRVNEQIKKRLQVDYGPFWGPHFQEVRNPNFPFHTTGMKERRLVEENCRKMKPIYQIGGNGSVGLQALYGIAYLARLRKYCKEQNIPFFCWPFDGWQLPTRGHVWMEVYPTLYNQGKRGDEEDASACVVEIAKLDSIGELRRMCEEVGLREEERLRASLEGWVLGVAADAEEIR